MKAKPKSQWLREAALYMIARSELNRSQKDALDAMAGSRSEIGRSGRDCQCRTRFPALSETISGWPICKICQGIDARVYWLGGDVAKLSAEYAGALQNPAEQGLRTDALVAEIDNKLLPQMVRKNDAASPMLSAMVLLYRMREPGYDYFVDGELPVLTAADLEATGEGSICKTQPRLFEYLQAAHAFYVQKDPAKVIQMIPDDARKSQAIPIWSSAVRCSCAAWRWKPLVIAMHAVSGNSYCPERTGLVSAALWNWHWP